MNEDEVYQDHITVDLPGCKYVMEFWERIQSGFGFQEHFGKNWDAFWDMLHWECPASKVTIVGANTLPKDWKALDGRTYAEKIQRILQLNKDFMSEYNENFNYEFIDA